MLPQMSADFASLQLQLVDRFVELGLGSYSDGVHRLTNFQRRLGRGQPTDPASNRVWIDLLTQLQLRHSHGARVDAIMNLFELLPPAVPEHIVHDWPTVGAFSIEQSGTMARTHFFAMDTDAAPREARRTQTRAPRSPLDCQSLELRSDGLFCLDSVSKRCHGSTR